MSKSGRTTAVRGSRGDQGDQCDSAEPGGRGDVISQAQRFAADWAPAAARVLLGLVLAWFGYHELMTPQLWTGYVPGIAATSQVAIALVLVHGWVLLVLAVAITAGVALRLAAAAAALLLLQIVISLTISGGLTDLTLRDVGVLGLAICLTGGTRQRAVLTR
ncbi:MAG TPA: hypothetical protein VMU94_28860 [Streptosporangiaceae bacterium]|nr:hypothetical protein [Streptosporangiaceae bacterium]